MRTVDLPTPALVVDDATLTANLATMAAARPGRQLRPHVKAHKCTELARRQLGLGHEAFTCATPREVVGMAAAGLGEDLLLANECLDGDRLRAMAGCDGRVTVAVDSPETVVAAADNGIREVLVDVDVGLPRCGCAPEDAGRIADLARTRGLEVRGVMGYEGHVYALAERAERVAATEQAMALLLEAHARVGGEVISAGATGTYDCNHWATEIQAGSYALMDTAFAALVPEFRPALFLVATVIHVSARHAVADCGLKALGMDHGAPTVEDTRARIVSDEHVTFRPRTPLRVGDRVRVWPAHVDPTVAYHATLAVAAGPGLEDEVREHWAVDLRGW